MTVRVLLAGLSDPIFENLEFSHRFQQAMADYGIEVDLGILALRDLNFEGRALHLNEAFASDQYDWILDVSGGNLANTCLPWLDLEAYGRCKAWFGGFSDLTSVLNALLQATGKPVLLLPLYYQSNMEALAKLLLHPDEPNSLILDTLYQSGVLPSSSEKGPQIIGGNIRCLLKLAGTPYFPSLVDSWIFLEGNSTSLYELLSLLAQLSQQKTFGQCAGLMFGMFNRAYASCSNADDIQSLLASLLARLGIQKPFLLIPSIGHMDNSQGIWLRQDILQEEQEER